jgi:hypothetical protein
VFKLSANEQDLMLGLLILALVMVLAQSDYDYRHSHGHINQPFNANHMPEARLETMMCRL